MPQSSKIPFTPGSIIVRDSRAFPVFMMVWGKKSRVTLMKTKEIGGLTSGCRVRAWVIIARTGPGDGNEGKEPLSRMHLPGQTKGWNGMGTTCHFQGRKETGMNPGSHHHKFLWPLLVIRVDMRWSILLVFGIMSDFLLKPENFYIVLWDSKSYLYHLF